MIEAYVETLGENECETFEEFEALCEKYKAMSEGQEEPECFG